jgi:hypothetical protein
VNVTDRDLLYNVTMATGVAMERGERHTRAVTHFLGDEKKAERQARRECRSCFYLVNGMGVIAGQAMTTKPCEICAADMTFGSTHTNRICAGCSEKHDLCAHCMGDIEMNERRRKLVRKGSRKRRGK